jgi:RNA polymerase primary sigma factor
MHSHRRDTRACPKVHHKAAVPCMVGAFRALATNNAEQLASLLSVSSTCLVARHSEMIARRKATLAELSRELGISRERVRQVQKEAEKLLETREHARLLRQATA